MITEKEFQQMKFQTFGFLEPDYGPVSCRVPKDYVMQKASLVDLRAAISNIVHDVKERKKITINDLITLHCNISMSTYKQYVSGKGEPTRAFLCKLCVGLQLSIEEANQLLCLHSGELNLTNDADCVTYYALKTRDSIEEYEDELKKYIHIKK